MSFGPGWIARGRAKHGAMLLGFVSLVLARNASAEPRPGLDTPSLFTAPNGVLSPGYPARHPISTAPPPDFVDARGSFPVVAITFNPVLAPVGKISGRLELAPFRAHALFAELSSLKFDVPGAGSTKISLTEIDVGYHLYPLEDGLRGVYLGPRYMHASGSTDLYVVSAWGIGGDVGYQFVIGPLALDFGIGAAYAKGSSDPSPNVMALLASMPTLSVPTHAEASSIVPLATAAIGLAF